MKIKVLKTIVYHGEVYKIGSETELSEEAVKAFGGEYVEVLDSPKPETAEAPEAKEPEKEEGKKSKKK